MGASSFTIDFGGGFLTPVDLSALVLRTLKGTAEMALGTPVRDAVITVPAYFKNPEREATKLAGKEAGLNVLQVINEPTAAAIAYGATRTAANRKLLVYDLGGGTFDVTVLEQNRADITVLTSTGDSELGGKDWDGWIVDYLAARFQEEHGFDPTANGEGLADIMVAVETAKKRLTNTQTARVSCTAGGRRGSYDLTREDFVAGTESLMQRTALLCRHVLDELGLEPNDIDGVLLVGGSTRMPMVREYIEREFGKPPLDGVDVDHVVALGAAMLAEELATKARKGAGRLYLPPVRARDVTNHSLGMIAISPENTAYLNARILPKNRPVPCEDTRPFTLRTHPSGPNRLEIFLTQGESEAPSDATYLGLYVADDVPHVRGGNALIDIAYAYDASGTVKVSGVLRETGKPLVIRIEPLPADVPDRFLGPPKPERAAQHVTAYLVFDLSGSMSGTPLIEAQKAARRFLAQMDLTNASVGIHGVADWNKTFVHACQDARRIEAAIASLRIGDPAVGGGNAGHPFDDLYNLMHGAEPPKFGIVLADGVWSNQPLAIERAKRCHAAGIEVVAVGFGHADKGLLRDIASSDEGSFFTSLDKLGDTFSTIAQAIAESGGHLGQHAGSVGGAQESGMRSLATWFSRKRS
jgi:molecular chaperone DnaK (HSP70)